MTLSEFLKVVTEPVDDPEFQRAQWAATGHLMRERKAWERLADDPRLPLSLRARCWENAKAIREELSP